MRAQRDRRVVRVGRVAWVAAAAAGLGVLVVHALWPFGGATARVLADDWLYNGLLIAAAATCLARAVLVGRERGAWALMAVGLAAWAVGDIYYVVSFPSSGEVSLPSAADWLYLGFYPPVYVAIGLLVRSRLTSFSRVVWLDGLIGALAVAALSAALVFPAVLQATGGEPLAVAVNLAYPVGDALLLALVAGVIAFTSSKPGDGWLLIASGFALFALSDTAYLYQAATGSYVEGTIIDVGWTAAAVLIASAAWSSSTRRSILQLEGTASLIAPAAFALAALAVLVVDHFDRVTATSVGLATAALATAIVRMVLTAQANHRLLLRTREDSLTDALTGLGNRRKLQRDLERLDLDSTPRALVLFDLDGFKNYNDSFGHPAGDALLARLGARLRAFAGERGEVYRMGGDEFCLFAELDRADAERYAHGAARTLHEAGEGFCITASYGAVRLPDESVRFAEALRMADQRMYERKSGGRVPAVLETSTVLTAALAERDASLGDHVQGVSELAEAVARRIGLPAAERAEVRIAGLVHDVGKMAIPEAILSKPGPLTSDERIYVERHTVVGERILQAAPSLAAAARIVRSSHECWNGSGYPDRLRGDDIPLGARIVFICDAFDAMISDRPYSPAMSPAEALEELRHCAGTQFDPAIVEAFAAVLAERVRAGEALLAPSAGEREPALG